MGRFVLDFDTERADDNCQQNQCDRGDRGQRSYGDFGDYTVAELNAQRTDTVIAHDALDFAEEVNAQTE